MKPTAPDPRRAPRLAMALLCRQYRLPRDALVARLLEYNACQHEDAATLRRRQCERLRATLEHAAARVPYYRELFARHSLQPADAATPETLGRLPILARQSLPEVQPQLHAQDASTNIRFAHSGGTSGAPIHTPHDLASRLSAQAARGRALGWCGAALWDRQAFLVSQRFTTARRLATALLDRALGRRRNATATFELTDARQTLNRFNRFCPGLLIGQSSLVFRLAHFAAELGMDLTRWHTRAALVNGEPLTAYMEELICRQIGCPVVDEYGCTEIGSIAHRCPAGTYHLNPEHVVVELVDDAGMPVGPGMPGRVVLTGLNNRAMPMIRYEVGDMALWAEHPCACGRQPGLAGLRGVLGRTRTVWRDPAGRPILAQDAVSQLQRQFADAGYWMTQWVQKASDVIEVRTEPKGMPTQDLLGEAGASLSREWGRPVTVVCHGQPPTWTRGGKLSCIFREMD